MFESSPEEINYDSLAHVTFLERTERLVDSLEMTILPSRQVARIDFERPIALADDIKILIQCTGSITDVSSFVWFNTKLIFLFLLILSFITHKDTLFVEEEIDSSGQRMKTESPHPSPHGPLSEKSLSKLRQNSASSLNRSGIGFHSFSSDEEESDSSRNYGTFTSSPSEKESESAIHSHVPIHSNSLYIRLLFADDFLTDERDPDFAVIRKDDHTGNSSNSEMKKTLRALGETRKKAKDIVVGSTHFLVNTTGRIGTSFISLVNGDSRETGSPSASTSSLSSSGPTSSSALLGKQRRRYEPRHIPIVQEEEDPSVIIPEIRRNMDESD